MTDAKGPTPEERIAIVFVHGQGQQRPMEDVQELARTMWDGDPTLKRADGSFAKTFVVPDSRLGGADFARVTTEAGKYNTRIDFFELYWAHFMKGNKFSHLASWCLQLTRRPRKNAPESLLILRQFAIRSCGAITLLALLSAFCTALLLRPGESSLWGGEPEAFLGWISPVNHVWMVGVLALIGIVGAWIGMIYNEIVGGRPDKSGDPTRQEIRNDALKGDRDAQWILLWALLLFFLVIFVAIWQGPTLQWGDVRIALFALVALASFFMINSKLLTAMNIALAAAGIAVVASLLGGMDGENLFLFDSPGEGHFKAIDSTFGVVARLLGLHVRGGYENFSQLGLASQILVGALGTIQVFCAVWFVGGFIKPIGAQANQNKRIFTLVIGILVAIGVGLIGFFLGLTDPPFIWLAFSLMATLMVIVIAVGVLFAFANEAFLVPVMADSARYLSREPENVSARQEIRAQGIKLLNKLHEVSSEGLGYQRIMIVAHSLGSVVAYELLADYWSRRTSRIILGPKDSKSDNVTEAIDGAITAGNALKAAARACEDSKKSGAKKGGGKTSAQPSPEAVFEQLREDYRDAQRRVSVALAGMPRSEGEIGAPWLITDFVTVGSPLTHSSILLADSPADLITRKRTRRLSTCPPTADGDYKDDNEGDTDRKSGGAASASVPPASPIEDQPPQDDGHTFTSWNGKRRLVHSSVFSAVRWTNLHFKTGNFILEGDLVGGKVGSQLGCGIFDDELDKGDTGKVFAHNEYWRSPLTTRRLRQTFAERNPPAHILALKIALRLRDTAKFLWPKDRDAKH